MTQPLLIMGATSGIGACAVDEALSRDMPVRAFGRGAAKLEDRPGLEPFVGDALDGEDVRRALTGCGAVIYALGVKERLSMLWQEETLFSQTTAILLAAMAETGVTRLVSVTGFGAGRSREAMSLPERVGHGALLGKIYADKGRQEDLIMASALDWTIARPVILTKGARSGRVKVLRSPETWRNGLVSRADVGAEADLIESGRPLYHSVLTRKITDPRFPPVGLRSRSAVTLSTATALSAMLAGRHQRRKAFPMYTVIGSPRSRAMRVLWMLEELEQPYELIPAAPRDEAVRAYNPAGKVPVLLVDGQPSPTASPS
jgi:putative NADH-flavin reductase